MQEELSRLNLEKESASLELEEIRDKISSAKEEYEKFLSAKEEKEREIDH